MKKKLSRGEQHYVDCFVGNPLETSKVSGLAHGTCKNYNRRPHVKQAIRERGESKDNELTVLPPVEPPLVPNGGVMNRAARQAWWSGVMTGLIEIPLTINGQPVIDEKTKKVVTTSAGLKERIKCSELLGRSEGDFVDKVKQLGPGNSVKGILAGRARAGMKAGKRNK
jgi:hypothetical protein